MAAFGHRETKIFFFKISTAVFDHGHFTMIFFSCFTFYFYFDFEIKTFFSSFNLNEKSFYTYVFYKKKKKNKDMPYF